MSEGLFGFVVSHPFAKKKAKGWGTVHFRRFGLRLVGIDGFWLDAGWSL